jgi:2-amino-4-hydroxy-6-hydroxymethyldihydropteridine diphosphokinase
MPGAIAYIGIGSNLGEPLQQVTRAVTALHALPESRVLAVSPWYGSSPVGGSAQQPDYINGAACLETRLSPQQLLQALQSIEQAHLRERNERWGARTLDLDLLLYDQQCINEATLTVPHPRLQERAFVLVPLHDIAPQLTLPNGRSLASLLPTVSREGLWPLTTTDTAQPPP